MKKILFLLTIFCAIFLDIYAQDAPSAYTQHYRLREWAAGANPSADSLNQNWKDLDSVIYAALNPDLSNVVYDNQTATITAMYTFGVNGGILFNTTGTNLLNVPYYTNPATMTTIPGMLGRQSGNNKHLLFGKSLGTGLWDTLAFLSDLEGISLTNLGNYPYYPEIAMIRTSGADGHSLYFVPGSVNDQIVFSDDDDLVLSDAMRKDIYVANASEMIWSEDTYTVTADYVLTGTSDYFLVFKFPILGKKLGTYMTVDSIEIRMKPNATSFSVDGFTLYKNVDGSQTEVYSYSTPIAGTNGVAKTFTFRPDYTLEGLPLKIQLTVTEQTYIYWVKYYLSTSTSGIF